MVVKIDFVSVSVYQFVALLAFKPFLTYRFQVMVKHFWDLKVRKHSLHSVGVGGLLLQSHRHNLHVCAHRWSWSLS